jgi:hypothetical protein
MDLQAALPFSIERSLSGPAKHYRCAQFDRLRYTISVQTPDAATISSAVLVRPGSPTHAFDQDQRLVGLFTVSSGSLTIIGPPQRTVAPPGYYAVFAE